MVKPLASRLQRDLGQCAYHIVLNVKMKRNPGEGIIGEKKKFIYSKVLKW